MRSSEQVFWTRLCNKKKSKVEIFYFCEVGDEPTKYDSAYNCYSALKYDSAQNYDSN